MLNWAATSVAAADFDAKLVCPGLASSGLAKLSTRFLGRASGCVNHTRAIVVQGREHWGQASWKKKNSTDRNTVGKHLVSMKRRLENKSTKEEAISGRDSTGAAALFCSQVMADGSRVPRAVEVDILPFGVLPVPDASLFCLSRVRNACPIDVLHEANISNASGIIP